jgi:glycosyltransferase involved in cell wall biosynthesis
MGKPIVASLRGESADILQDSAAAALVVGPRTDAAMSAAVNPNAGPWTGRRWERAGAAFVAQNYSRAGLASRYEEFLTETRRRYLRGAG